MRSTKSWLKIWLLSVNFEKFASINKDGPIIVEHLKCCP